MIVIIVLTSKGELQNVLANNVASYEFRRLDVSSLQSGKGIWHLARQVWLWGGGEKPVP